MGVCGMMNKDIAYSDFDHAIRYGGYTLYLAICNTWDRIEVMGVAEKDSIQMPTWMKTVQML